MDDEIKKVALDDPKSYIMINLHGAKKRLTLNGHDLLIQTVRADGKTASTHPCTPNFANKDNQYGLPQHGPAREAVWKKLDETEDSISLTYSISGGIYPEGLKVTQTVRITPSQFDLYTIHTNSSEVSVPVIYGEHFYWRAPQGADGVCINDKDISTFEGFSKKFHSDGVVIPLEEENKIEIPGMPSIYLVQENMPLAVMWQGEDDSDYICIEPVTMNPQRDEKNNPYFGSNQSLIAPGQTKTAFISVRVEE